jgi:hypothetical protein
LALAHRLAAEENASVPAPTVEHSETNAIASQEKDAQVTNAWESVQMLSGSLAVANETAERFRQKYSDLQRRTEALGVEAFSEDQTRLEQRLLNAVSDLRLMQKERDKYRDQALGLSEAVVRFLRTSTGGDALARMEVEAQLRASRDLAAESKTSTDITGTLMDGQVVSVKEEWLLVVGNLGQKQGVRMGMPLRVTRGDKLIATLRVIDVRQRICGAVIQATDFGKVNVGDRLQADVQQGVK